MAYKTTQNKDVEKSKQKKRLYKRSQLKLEFKVRKSKEYTYSYSTPTPYQEDILRPMPSFYPPMYPIVNEWTPLVPVQCPIIPLRPVPIILNPIPTLPSPIFQYYPPPPIPSLPPLPGPSVPPFPPPLIPPFPPPNITSFPPPNISPSSSFSFETSLNTDLDTSADISREIEIRKLEDFNPLLNDSLETYLHLPKDLFPSARMLTLNPNAIIDEFCLEPNVAGHADWILDLEFGVPKWPITRPIPIYNVKLNSINCKNTPEAIHPGFESCSQHFKKNLLFYYDCVISSWYRSYVLVKNDKSVDNFQCWLSTAMQELGMCWP